MGAARAFSSSRKEANSEPLSSESAVEYVSCEPLDGQKELFPEQYGEGDDSFEEEETEQA